ncbi:hypothetical protein CsSME_00022276 [Camellia sinensis var. sinensis]
MRHIEMKESRTNTDDDNVDDQPPSSSSVNIPLHILFFEIFTRLPVKSLCRFRCVCKSIRSLTLNNNNDPFFLDLHLSRSQTRPQATTLLIPAIRSGNSFEILSAEVGGGPLTHLYTIPGGYDYHHRTFSFDVNGLLFFPGDSCSNTCPFVCNPTTRQFLKLPPLESCNPDTCYQVIDYFLGFDPSTRIFKVVNIHLYLESDMMVCRVFTLGSHSSGGSWRTIHPGFPFEGCGWFINPTKSVCLNGAIHWFLKAKNVIVAFDLKDENFHVIPLPNHDGGVFQCQLSQTVLIQVNGFLAVIGYNYPRFRIRKMEMWVLEDYQRHVWINHIIDLPCSDYQYFRPLGSIPTGEILLLPYRNLSSVVSEVRVFYYDMKNRSFRITEIIQPPKGVCWYVSNYFCMTSYTGTLFFPEG